MMARTIFLLLFFVSMGLSGFSQTEPPKYCGFTERLEQMKTAGYHNDADFERIMQQKIQEYRSSGGVRDIITIPVVVHVIHNGEPIGQGPNISDAQVFSQMKVLNDDFRRKEGTNGYNTHPNGADVEIEFCLASVDIDGNEFNGIDRQDMGVAAWESMGDMDLLLKTQTIWDPTKYYNVWVCNMEVNTSGGGILLGYAQFPGLSGLPGMPSGPEVSNTDGVVINYRYFGSVHDNDGTFNISGSALGRTLTHETGHWLGLRHIWGDGDCDVDDFCDDTPLAAGPSSGCNPSQYNCGSIDMVQNYMDYSSDFCMDMFTQDQKERMLAVMMNSPRRMELRSSDACSGPPFVAIAASATAGCPIFTVEFSDLSTQNPTSWAWSFPGGDPSSSTLESPVVSYSSSGSYDVTLSATNEYGTRSTTFSNYINTVSDFPEAIFEEDFENGDLSTWTIDSPLSDGRWQLYEANYTSDRSGDYFLGFKNHGAGHYGARSGITSPSFNLYGRTEATLTFDYAYKRAVQAETDSLVVYISTDGGNSFPHRLLADAEDGMGSFATGGLFNGDFEPASQGDWCGQINSCISLDLSSFLGQEDVRVKFENYSKNGSNFYIDNVVVESICVSENTIPQADFYADGDLCGTTNLQFIDQSIGVPSSWSWSFPGGTPSSSTNPNPTVEYTTPGDYEVTLTVSNASGSSTVTRQGYVTVSDTNPTADFSFDIVTGGPGVSFTNNSSNATSYFWDFGDGSTSTEASPSHYFNPSGETSYTVTLTSNNGCGSDEMTMDVLLTSISEPFGPATSLGVFPNPNGGQFVVEVEGKAGRRAHLEVFDMLGRSVYSKAYDLDSGQSKEGVDISQLATGTYIIKVDVDGQSAFERIAVR